jgi:hypothetical protein
MLAFRLLSHVWKQSLRSASRGQKTAGNIFVLILVLMVALNLFGLGLFFQAYLKEKHPGADPLLLFNGWLIYYFGIDLLLRQMMQRIPGQAVVPYLTLPVKKSLLVHLLLFRSFFSSFNLLPWVFLIPFAASTVLPAAGAGSALGWLIALGSMVAANSLLNLLLKKLAVRSFAIALALIAAIGSFFALDFLHVMSLASVSRALLGAALEHPVLSAAALLAPVVLYTLVFTVARGKMHLEHLASVTAAREDTSSRYRVLESRGMRGRFLALELKMFFRNRRSRTTMIIALAIFPLGILYYGLLRETQGEPYPLPSQPVLEAARQSLPRTATEGWHLITFRVDTGIAPPSTHIYVTGNHAVLANWKPSAVPLLRNPDSTWSRSFLIEEGDSLRYCFTLGAWQTEEKVGDGSEPSVHTLTVRSDTTIYRSAIAWKTPEFPLFMKINLLYWGLFVTGMLMFAYGQCLLAWNSTYFDALLTWRLSFRWILNTKALILFAAAMLSFLLTIPFAFMDSRILLFNGLAFLYNIGVNSYVMLLLASRNRKRFELEESLFSQQGKGAAQFVAIVPMWILPIILYGVLEGIGVPYVLYLMFGGLGILGLLLHRPLLARAFGSLEKQRYAIAAGFRKGGET